MRTFQKQFWLDPAKYQPPTGILLLLKTRYGMPCIGKWNPEVGYVGWQYLPE